VLGKLRKAIDASFWSAVAGAHLPGEQYTDPPGDPGLFGPDSAIWYVHGDVSSVVGGIGGLILGTLNEPVMHGTNQFSDFRNDPVKRLGYTVSFVLGMTYGSTPVADKLTGLVHGMHQRVHGTMPDGRTFDAARSEDIVWVGATQAYCTAQAHRRYHPRPLSGQDIDRYYADYAVISSKLGAVDVPASREEINDYFATMRPRLTVSEETRQAVRFLRTPYARDPIGRLSGRALTAAATDLLPQWAKDLLGTRTSAPVMRAAGLALTKTLRFGVRYRAVETATKRVAAR
jgi:uncharacterized protein (DUF2236 family)